MRRATSGWIFMVTSFLACPCHLVITLPLAAALLSGTALGGWVATHHGAITVGASIYFIGALAAGAALLSVGKGVLALAPASTPRCQQSGVSDGCASTQCRE